MSLIISLCLMYLQKYTQLQIFFVDKKWINKRCAGVMACDDAKISENAINAGSIMGDVGTFSGNISGNKIGSSTGSFKNGQIASESM